MGDAAVGFTGVIIGALITGFIAYFQSKHSIDTNLDIKKLKSNLKNNDFIMYSMFYTPELSVQMKELTDKLGGVIKSLSELIIKSEGNRNEKEKLIGSVVTSSLELEDKVKNIQQELAKMANQLIST
jgi:hypothetical protein